MMLDVVSLGSYACAATAEQRQGDGPGGDVTTLVSATRPVQTQLLKNAKEKKVR